MSQTRTQRRVKRVALLYHGFGFGGVEIHTMMMWRYMDRTRYEPVLVIPGYFCAMDQTQKFRDELHAQGIPFLRSPDDGHEGLGNYLKTLNNLKRFWIEQKIDLIHIQTSVPGSLQKDTLAAAMAGVPVLRTEHQPPSAYMAASDPLTTKIFDLFTSYIVVDSMASLEEELQLVKRSRKKLYCSPTGIEVDRFNPDHDVRAAKERLGLDPAVPVIGTVGRLHEQKGPGYLIEALRSVIDQAGPVNLVLVGDGPMRDELEAQVERLALKPYVHFMGFKREYLPIVEAMDIGTMPSIWEGFSLSMLELMAMGKLMVVTDHPSFHAAIDDGRSGYIVPVRDSKALAGAFVKLLNDREQIARFRAANISKVRANFSIQRLLGDMMDLYDKMLGSSDLQRTARSQAQSIG